MFSYREWLGSSLVVLARYDFGVLSGLLQSLDRRRLYEHNVGFKLCCPKVFYGLNGERTENI